MPGTPHLKIYIAGPDVFLPNAPELARRKKELCTHHNLIALHPLDNQADTAPAIYASNRAMMLEADAIIANLTPFRGPSADPGTVFEVGHMTALGRPAFGYTLDPTPYAARVTPDADAIEDFGLHDNLMIDCALQAFIVPTHPDAPDIDRHLDCFERCLVTATAHFKRCTGEGHSPYARSRHPRGTP